MRAIIKQTFFDFSAKREGFTPFMYCDVLNLVTTGIGNLIDAGPRNGFDISASAMAPAMSLPWKFKAPGWTPKNPVAAGNASQAEIRESWIRTKLREEQEPGFNKKGGFAYANFQPLTLDLDGLRALFDRTLASFDRTLASRYPTYERAPADAQQALLSMAWAMGPAFNFPQFKAAFDANDFRKAAELSFFKGGGGTLETPEQRKAGITTRAGRNRENDIMLNNAADVLKAGADPDRLFFPGTVGTTPGAVAAGGSGGGIANISGSNPRIEDVAIIGTGVAAAGWAGWELWKHFRKGK